jgi:hypothetical protein
LNKSESSSKGNLTNVWLREEFQGVEVVLLGEADRDLGEAVEEREEDGAEDEVEGVVREVDEGMGEVEVEVEFWIGFAW